MRSSGGGGGSAVAVGDGDGDGDDPGEDGCEGDGLGEAEGLCEGVWLALPLQAASVKMSSAAISRAISFLP